MSYLQIPDTLYESNVFFALSPTAKNILWLAGRKHMKFWTAKKKMVIFGLSQSEIISLGIGHNHIAPALRELQAAGLIVLVQAGYGGEAIKKGLVSQYRLAFLDEGRRHAFEEPHPVVEWKEILTKARECKENPKTPKQGQPLSPKQGYVPPPKTPKQGYLEGKSPRPRNRDTSISTAISLEEQAHGRAGADRPAGPAQPSDRTNRIGQTSPVVERWLSRAYGGKAKLAAARDSAE